MFAHPPGALSQRSTSRRSEVWRSLSRVLVCQSSAHASNQPDARTHTPQQSSLSLVIITPSRNHITPSIVNLTSLARQTHFIRHNPISQLPAQRGAAHNRARCGDRCAPFRRSKASNDARTITTHTLSSLHPHTAVQSGIRDKTRPKIRVGRLLPSPHHITTITSERASQPELSGESSSSNRKRQPRSPPLTTQQPPRSKVKHTTTSPPPFFVLLTTF
jgi:hypothetical protein